ncbi:MAG: tryptophan synthase subunit alpha, partial [Elusimicrobiota bacterium]|nr:tryptophan synthase subunit alpha [Elusimicrobiota bacterium]
MNRLREKFVQLKKENRKALVCFLTAGFPDLKITEKIITILESCGTDIIELGVPFSDPIADGQIIQYTSFQALKNKISLKKILQFIKKIRLNSQMPIVIMSYLNPIHNYGLEKFFKDGKSYGVDGLIIPDLIPEEGKIIENFSYKYHLPIIYLLSTTTSEVRQKLIFNKSKEFVYVVSVTGVTGPREK